MRRRWGMHRRHYPLVGAFFVLACCGGEEPTGMGVAVQRSALAGDIIRARIQVHVKERSCADVKNSGPEKRASYSVDVDVGGGSGSGEIQSIRPGTYTVAVWTFNT